jgi:ubiquitin carboxyl-terminal hydrolase L3
MQFISILRLCSVVSLQLEEGFLKKFLDDTKEFSYSARGEHLENAQEIIDTHMESAQEGQTEVFVSQK